MIAATCSIETGDRQGPTARERRRGLIVLLADAFLMWAGFFMVVPLISVHYVEGLGWSAGAVGIVLAARQLTQQGLTVLGGAAADRLGAKRLICAGMVIRGLAFAAMAVADTFPLLLVTAIAAAAGGSLFEAPRSAAIAALTEERERARYYSLNGVVGGLGLTIGPFIGVLLLDVGFAVVALVSGACYFVTLAVTWFWLPEVRVATAGAASMSAGLRLALGDRHFVRFNSLLMGFWFINVQLAISVTLAATAIAGTRDAVSWVYGVNAGMAVILQYPVLRLAERWLRHEQILIVGIGLMAVGLGAIAAAGGVVTLLACIALFSLGSLLASPSQQTVTARLANPVAFGSYFGVASLGLAFGGGLGNFAGGLLYELGERHDLPALPWLSFALIGLATAFGLLRVERRLVSDAARPLRPDARLVEKGAGR